jgi:hypothetical protein
LKLLGADTGSFTNQILFRCAPARLHLVDVNVAMMSGTRPVCTGP